MNEEPSSKSFWQTLPGIFTAIAGFITAVTGLVIGLHQAGIIGNGDKAASEASVTASSAGGEGAPQTQRTSNPSATAATPSTPEAAQPTTAAVLSTPAATSAAAAADQTSGHASTPTSARINLLSPENGGQIILAPSSEWLATIDGKENGTYINGSVGASAVYAFKDERAATIDTFAILIDAATEYNVKEFELSVATDSPTGSFQSLGKFQTQNIRLFKTPYQEFKFAPVKAKYFKFKLISNYGTTPTSYVYEFQLFGRLN